MTKTAREVIADYLDTQRDIEGPKTLISDIFQALDDGGFVIMPKEPTIEMLSCLEGTYHTTKYSERDVMILRTRYEKMLTAAASQK